MSIATNGRSDPTGLSARVLIAGSDLLADALAGALSSCGFATKHIRASHSGATEGIEWAPDLLVLDGQSFDDDTGAGFIDCVRRTGVQVCVIDSTEDKQRSSAWLQAGSAALVDRNEPLDQLVRTINRLLRANPSPRMVRKPSPTKRAAERRDARSWPFAALTEREQHVLAELMEGRCAEEIARAGFVSISTVRSQIKAILQKLGVNSQLAAVAMARRADWSPRAAAG